MLKKNCYATVLMFLASELPAAGMLGILPQVLPVPEPRSYGPKSSWLTASELESFLSASGDCAAPVRVLVRFTFAVGSGSWQFSFSLPKE